jgi:hypothetical protein
MIFRVSADSNKAAALLFCMINAGLDQHLTDALTPMLWLHKQMMHVISPRPKLQLCHRGKRSIPAQHGVRCCHNHRQPRIVPRDIPFKRFPCQRRSITMVCGQCMNHLKQVGQISRTSGPCCDRCNMWHSKFLKRDATCALCPRGWRSVDIKLRERTAIIRRSDTGRVHVSKQSWLRIYGPKSDVNWPASATLGSHQTGPRDANPAHRLL